MFRHTGTADAAHRAGTTRSSKYGTCMHGQLGNCELKSLPDASVTLATRPLFHVWTSRTYAADVDFSPLKMFQIPNMICPQDPVVVHLSQEYVDSATQLQIKSMCGHPATSHIRIMPDCHKGSGTCVGFTSHLTKTVSPGLIGGDIGCGVSAYPLPPSLMQRESGRKKIKRAIRSWIPMGQCKHSDPIIAEEQYEVFYNECRELAATFANTYDERFATDAGALRMSENLPPYSKEWVKQRCSVFGLHYYNDYLCCMGTLGSGNHFVEVDGTDDEEAFLLVVHSGSRALGQAVYQYWSRLTRNGGEQASLHKDSKSGVDFAKRCDDDEPLDFDRSNYLQGISAFQYFFDMIWAQKYAEMNRIAMLSSVIAELGIPFDQSKIVQSVHNYIDFRDLVIRKGAIRAEKGEKCIIALNMRDGILVGTGLGNGEWNSSAAHGCGRVVTRGTASKRGGSKADVESALRKFRREMEGVDCDTVVAETLDERPSAYREPQIVLRALTPTVDVESALRLRTFICAKGTR